MGYVDYPATIDVDAIVAQSLAALQSALGITLNEGNPLVALLEVAALREAETRVVMTDVSAAAFRDFGQKVVGVEPIEAASATMTVQFTVKDTAGYTIPSGTRVVYKRTGSDLVGFATTAALTITPGNTTGTVEAAAIVAGDDANGLEAASLTLLDPLSHVTAVASTATSSGGEDAETALEYLDRLSDELRLLTLVPRLEGEFAQVALRVPGVGRARDIRGWDAVEELADQPGHVTVAVTDVDGAPVGSTVKDAVEALLTSEDRRALNVVVHVVDPESVAITVDFVGVSLPGYDPVTVASDAVAAVEAWLSPANWAANTDGTWGDETIVRYQELSALLHNVDGFDRWTSLTLNGGTSDVNMAPDDEVAPLPDATVTGAMS